jgi:hypothetical protein
MHSEQRAANATALIEEWRPQNRAMPLTVRAVSFGRMAAPFVDRLRPPSPPAPGIVITVADARLACSFFEEVLRTSEVAVTALAKSASVRKGEIE